MARQISEAELMRRVLKWLPADVPPEAIESVECDPWDGSNGGHSYWVYLNDGWMTLSTECHTAHEDNLKEIRAAVEEIVAWPDDPAITLHNGYTRYDEDFTD